MFNRSLQFTAVLFLVSVVMSIFSGTAWLFDLVSHFPVQSIIALLPLSLLALFQKLRITFVLFCTALAFNVTTLAKTEWLSDRQHLASTTAISGTPYRLMTLNVLVTNTQHEKIGELITEHKPDTVLIVELTPALAKHLAQQLTEYPHFYGQPEQRAAGIGIFSRHPMVNTETLALGNQSTPAVHIKQLLPQTALGQSTSISIIGVHPWAPVAPEMHRLRTIQLRELGSTIKRLDLPLVVAGDFNITPWSGDFRSLLEVGQLTDTRVGFGIQGTWPSCLPLLSIPIDHVLTSSVIEVADRRVVKINGSDHCGVVADLLVQ